jgi:tellurite methyltransferase
MADATAYLETSPAYDLIIMYGLLHCLSSETDISNMITLALRKTLPGGTHILVAFNDGLQDLTAHPHFRPTLVSHAFYCDQYKGHTIMSDSSSVLHEIHPHNNIPHFHSISRLVARVTSDVPR